jgi:hypothetical protein
MPTDNDRPSVIPSPVDPDVECVRIDTQVPSGELASPPGPPLIRRDDSRSLCPEGYVPRRRRRGDYTLEGKEIITGTPPKRNPDDPTGD